MTEISFHFNVPDKMAHACRVLRKAVNAGSRVTVAAGAPALAQLDAALWTFTPLDFIPHSRFDGDPVVVATSPVLLGGSAQCASPEILLNMGFEVATGFEQFEKVIELVSNEEEDRQAARSRWKHYASRGYAITRHDLALRASGVDNT